MAEVLKRKKPMAVSPLKASQTLGAAIAFLGVNRSIPMMHGSQGCTAFGKVFFVRHFREPIPLQTTAMDQASSVMGADENVVQGLKAICEKTKPDLIGLPTTGLAETQGCDIERNVKEFRNLYPQFDNIRVVPVNTPDFTGAFETGYAAAVAALIDRLVPSAGDTPARDSDVPMDPDRKRPSVNVLASSALSVGDVEWIKETVELFGLRPVVIPDLSDSLDGHLTDRDFSPVSVGGTPVEAFARLHEAVGTIVVGASLTKAADLLRTRSGVDDVRFDHLMGLEATDQFLMTLSQWSGQPVPPLLERQRSQLLDSMLDTHFAIGQARVAIAADPDLLIAFASLLKELGGEVVVAVTPASAKSLTRVPCNDVQVGDLEDLEMLARERDVEILVGNSHAVASAQRLDVPILRAGFPQYDFVGGYTRTWIGYRATRQTLFDLANALAEVREHNVPVHHSIYSQKSEPSMARSQAVFSTTSEEVPDHVA